MLGLLAVRVALYGFGFGGLGFWIIWCFGICFVIVFTSVACGLCWWYVVALWTMALGGLIRCCFLFNLLFSGILAFCFVVVGRVGVVFAVGFAIVMLVLVF